MLRARALTCVDGVDLTLMQQAIVEQRRFFKERETKDEYASSLLWEPSYIIVINSELFIVFLYNLRICDFVSTSQ